MKIAVVYENGNVNPHFGTATCVKFYEVNDGKVISTDMVEMKQAGHGFIAPVLFQNGAEAVICGNIKPGAANAIVLSGLMLCAGVSGDADAAVEAYIAGSLTHNPDAIDIDEICGHDDDDHDHQH